MVLAERRRLITQIKADELESVIEVFSDKKQRQGFY